MAAPRNVAQKLLESHLVSGTLDPGPGSELAIRMGVELGGLAGGLIPLMRCRLGHAA